MEQSVLSLPACMAREKKTRNFSLGRVLIVEQHPDIANMLHWALKLEGYEPVVAHNKDWIDQMIVQENDFLAIVLDLSKESWFNRNVIIQLLEERWSVFHSSKPPLVILTTFLSTDKSLNGYPLVHKPFHIGDLRASVELVVSRKK